MRFLAGETRHLVSHRTVAVERRGALRHRVPRHRCRVPGERIAARSAISSPIPCHGRWSRTATPERRHPGDGRPMEGCRVVEVESDSRRPFRLECTRRDSWRGSYLYLLTSPTYGREQGHGKRTDDLDRANRETSRHFSLQGLALGVRRSAAADDALGLHCHPKLRWIRNDVERQWVRSLRRRSQRHRLFWTHLRSRPWFELPKPILAHATA